MSSLFYIDLYKSSKDLILRSLAFEIIESSNYRSFVQIDKMFRKFKQVSPKNRQKA